MLRTGLASFVSEDVVLGDVSAVLAAVDTNRTSTSDNVLRCSC